MSSKAPSVALDGYAESRRLRPTRQCLCRTREKLYFQMGLTSGPPIHLFNRRSMRSTNRYQQSAVGLLMPFSLRRRSATLVLNVLNVARVVARRPRAPPGSPSPSHTPTLVDPVGQAQAAIEEVHAVMTEVTLHSDLPHATLTHWQATLQTASHILHHSMVSHGVDPSLLMDDRNPHQWSRTVPFTEMHPHYRFDWTAIHLAVINHLVAAHTSIHEHRLMDAYGEVKQAEWWLEAAKRAIARAQRWQ